MSGADDFRDYLNRVEKVSETGFEGPPLAKPVQVDVYRCILCKREVPEAQGYRVLAGFVCSACSSEFDAAEI